MAAETGEGSISDGKERAPGRRAAGWIPWLIAGAILAAVLAVALHITENREFILLLEKAEPWWLLVAALLQAATYLAQGEIWPS